MESYGYVAPSSIAEVLALLNESTSAGQMTQLLAGGSDVLVQMRMPNHQPRTIVDIKKLAETNRLEVSAEGIYIGAAVSSAVMNEHPGLQKALPGLLEAADLILPWRAAHGLPPSYAAPPAPSSVTARNAYDKPPIWDEVG